MVKAVFIQNPHSIYDDRPGEAYHFPQMYLGTVRQTVGDWVVFYESRKGAFGYVAVQKVLSVEADPAMPGHHYARLDPGTLWEFEQVVGRSDADGRPLESMLRDEVGRPLKGGANVLAVRRLPDAEFAAIVGRGLAEVPGPESLPRLGSWPEGERPAASGETFGLANGHEPFGPAPLAGARESVLMSRPLRDASFRRQVLRAYDNRCAISGLALRNGGGRAEVQAAHIRPVDQGGPDTVRNGLALSGTLHWMFDRGLIAVADDLTILVSHNKVDRETADRLIGREGRLRLPQSPRHHPHPDYLRYHRENVFALSTG
ncbi:HNH endonuclease [Wenxinia saemankumensis]|uniref:Putative restriction endonuclease n=1 Tax=Wenxinia saemankumensis TaxID=1447782 RepID=A0A1M6CPI3_9RHOB|nr:HNH endonuclease [Wenxinia saemankumensis]SHI62965.1 putative restriction endonuclease [Wenxinia saemankumensis]